MNEHVIDLKQGTQLVGNNAELAKELIQHLVKLLPKDYNDIHEAYLDNDIAKLSQMIHRLHGAVSYCGTPQLKSILVELEDSLKKNQLHHLSALMATLGEATQNVIKQATELSE